MCLYPELVQNPKYKPNKKNGGVIPAVPDARVKYVPVGCGNCMECRKQKSNQWRVRLAEEVKHSNERGWMVTLTFSNESIAKVIGQLSEETQQLTGYEMDNAIATRAIRLFLERWRKKYKTSLRHWFITELGHQGTENIHLHGIVWTDYQKARTLKDVWGYGFVWDGITEYGEVKSWVNEQTVNYMTKYVTKLDPLHKNYRSIILTSPGIGRQYINTPAAAANVYNGEKTQEAYYTSKGIKIGLPIYYRNKIYSEAEREKLWLQKLDKNERWVDGIKIDISKEEKRYYAVLKDARKKNKLLGYGSNEKNWEQETYERQRREILRNERVKGFKAKGI